MAKCSQCSNQASTGLIYIDINLKTLTVSNRCSDCRAMINACWQNERNDRLKNAKNEWEEKKKKDEEEKEKNKPVSSCDQCYKNFKNGDSYYTLTWEGKKLAFCSKSCSSNYGEKLKRENNKHYDNLKKKAEENLEKSKQEWLDLLSETMKKGEDISEFNFENVDWISEEYKEICRKYVKNRKEVEELEKQKDKLKEQQENKKCDKCSKKGVAYYLPEKNDDKEFCSKICCSEYYTQLANPSNNSKENNSNYNPTSLDNPSFDNSNKPNKDNEKINCPSCNKELTENTLDNHTDQNPKCKVAGEAFDKIVNKKERVDVDKLDLTKQGKTTLQALIIIHIDKKWVDVDKLDLPEKSRKELKRVMEELGIREKKDYYDDEINKLKKEPEYKKFYKQPWFIIGVAVVLLAVIVISIKNNRKPKMKKNSKENKG